MEGFDEEFLSLKLSMVTDYGGEKRRKRMRTETQSHSSLIEMCEEGKIFALLQTRKHMLKREHEVRNVPNHVEVEGLHLIHQLLKSAASVDKNNIGTAVESLCDLYQNVSLMGDSVQRVAAYFADGLAARLLTQKSPFYDTIMKGPTPDEEFLAFTEFYKVSPLHQFAHFTANQAILEAFEKEENTNGSRALHAIDFDISYGFQWPSLMQSLSEKATTTNQISLKITGYGRSVEELEQTKSRLVSFAKGFRNIVFEFHGLVTGSKLVKPRKKKNEVVAVNLVLNRNSLRSLCQISDTLKYIYSLCPSVVVLVEQDESTNTYKFLQRFVELLHYSAAIFDSLDDCLPLDSAERLSIEKNHLGGEIKCAITTNYHTDSATNPKIEKMETWKERMESHGFYGIRQSSKAILQAKLLIKIRSYCSPIKLAEENGGFRICERDDGKAISLGWQKRFLITASSWCCTA